MGLGCHEAFPVVPVIFDDIRGLIEGLTSRIFAIEAVNGGVCL